MGVNVDKAGGDNLPTRIDFVRARFGHVADLCDQAIADANIDLFGIDGLTIEHNPVSDYNVHLHGPFPPGSRAAKNFRIRSPDMA